MASDDFESVCAQVVRDFKAIDYRPLFDSDIQLDIAHEIRGNFLRQARSNNEPWRELAQSTINAKGHDTILVETGELAKASADKGHGKHLHRATQHELLFGEVTEHGHWHMTGTSRMPARPYMEISGDVVDLIADRVLSFAVQELRA